MWGMMSKYGFDRWIKAGCITWWILLCVDIVQELQISRGPDRIMPPVTFYGNRAGAERLGCAAQRGKKTGCTVIHSVVHSFAQGG